MPFGVKISDARYVLESLRPHRAGIHPQSPADRAGNSFHPFKPTEICRTRGVSHLPQLYARACRDFTRRPPFSRNRRRADERLPRGCRRREQEDSIRVRLRIAVDVRRGKSE